MGAKIPRHRQDLSFTSQETDAGNFYIVKVPETGQFYRFGEIEYFIIGQLDGKNSAATICSKTAAKYDSTLDAETLDGFIASLRQRGLLENEPSHPPANLQKRGRLRGSLLYLRFNAFNPDKLLDYLVVKIRFIFTPYFLGISATLILLSWLILVANAEEIQYSLINQLSAKTLLSAWIVILLTVTAHEFSHGLTCKYFGGQVHELGFLLLFFMPAFFCNVSDAWLFPQKSRRLWVTFAGAYCELFLWALAILIWRVTAPETSIHSLALIMIGTSGIRILFNFNPLIKLDGYYMLSDYLDIPNLRARASYYLRQKIKQLFGSGSGISEAFKPREQRIYLFYGLFSGIFTILFLGYIVSKIGGFLIESLQGTGFIIFMVLFMLVTRNHIAMLLHKSRSFTATIKMLKKIPLIKLVLSSILLASLFFIKLNLTVSGEFQVFPAQNADIRSQVEAIIEEIYVNEGDWVKKGDPVARLSDRDMRSELWKVEAKVQEQQARLKLLLAGPIEENVARARGEIERAKIRYRLALLKTEEAEMMRINKITMLKIDVEKAETKLAYAKKKRTRFHTLALRKAVPEVKLEEVNEEATVRQKELTEARVEWEMEQANMNAETKKDLAAAENAIKKAQDELNFLLAGSRLEEVEATQAIITGLQGEKNYLQNLLELIIVSSPISGVVTTPKPDEKVGQKIGIGELIMEVYDTSTVKVETFIPEKEIGDVRMGQKISLKARAYPDKLFSGTVTAIAPMAMKDKSELNRKVVRVITEIDNKSLLLKPEMTGHAKIYCGKKNIFDLLTRRLIRYFRVEFWSWW
jgi:multidrug resistance efflux pump